MKTDLAVPGSVNPVVRMAEIKDQQINEILEYNERKKSPFRKWVQMNYDDDAYKADDFLVANSPTAYRIFKFLIANMDRYNAVIVSYKVLQQVFGYGQATVARAIITASEQDKATQAKIRTQIKKRQEVIQSPPSFQEQIRQAQSLDKGE